MYAAAADPVTGFPVVFPWTSAIRIASSVNRFSESRSRRWTTYGTYSAEATKLCPRQSIANMSLLTIRWDTFRTPPALHRCVDSDAMRIPPLSPPEHESRTERASSAQGDSVMCHRARKKMSFRFAHFYSQSVTCTHRTAPRPPTAH